MFPSIVSPTAAIVTEAAAGAAAHVTALSAAAEAGSISKTADPAIAQSAVTVFRMRINLAWQAGALGVTTRCGSMRRCAIVSQAAPELTPSGRTRGLPPLS